MYVCLLSEDWTSVHVEYTSCLNPYQTVPRIRGTEYIILVTLYITSFGTLCWLRNAAGVLDLQHISRWAKTAQRLPRNRQNGVGRAYIPHNLAISEDHPAPAWGILPGQDNSNCPLCSGVTVFCNRFLAKCNSFVLQNILHNSVPHLEQKNRYICVTKRLQTSCNRHVCT